MKRAREEKAKATTKFDLEQKTKLYTLGDGKSWILSTLMDKVDRPTKEEIATLWSLQPKERSVIQMFNKPTPVPRYDQSFSNEGKGYRFSGVTHEAKPIPEIVAGYLAYANRVCETILSNDYEGRTFNAVFVNWYLDGKDYIGFHSDDETQLYKNNRGETLVFSISFGQERRFLLKPSDKKSPEKVKEVPLHDCTVLLMGGLTQVNYKHSVPKVQSKIPLKGRINITFRMFK